MPPAIEILLFVVAVFLIAVVLEAARRGGRATRVVHEWEHALLYEDGRYVRLLEPGRYRLGSFWKSREIYALVKFDQPTTSLPIDVASADGFLFRVTVALTYRITDPRAAQETASERLVRQVADVAADAAVARRPLQTILSDRQAVAAEILAAVAGSLPGIEIVKLAIGQLTLPPETRRLFSEVERAKLEGQAALERARGEQAALRSLANAARMLKGNPELMNLRVLHALSAAPGRAAPTIVLGDGVMQPVRPEQGVPDEV